MALSMFTGCDNILRSSNSGNSSGKNSSLEGQGDSNTTYGKKVELSLYFPSKDNSRVLVEKREIPVKDGAVMKAAVEALIEGPENEELRKVIPDGTTLLSIKKEGNVAVVDFSKEYTKVNGLDEIVERVSVINTLTEIQGIEKVRILVEGERLIGPSGEPFGDLTRVALDSEGRPKQDGGKVITLYFGDSQAEYVVAETRMVQFDQSESIEKIVFEELKKGPVTKGLDPVIPKGTQLLSVKTQDGICTLNLSKEFINNHMGGTAGEAMTINAIVNSLTELPNINKVQFLIEGQIREVFIHGALDTPIERNESIIKND